MLRIRHSVLILATAYLAACAPQTQVSSSGVDSQCELTAAELQQVKEKAYDYLVEEWPVADKACEEISDAVSATEPGKCAIAGGAKRVSGCAEPMHEGFSIVFDRATLEPEEIHFKTE